MDIMFVSVSQVADVADAYDLEDPDNAWPKSIAGSQERPITEDTPLLTIDVLSAHCGRRIADLRSSVANHIFDLSAKDEEDGWSRDMERHRKSRRSDTFSPHRSIDHEKVSHNAESKYVIRA